MYKSYEYYYYKNSITVIAEQAGPISDLFINEDLESPLTSQYNLQLYTDGIPVNISTNDGFFLLGIRLEKTLYENPELREKLSMFTRQECETMFKGASLQTISTHSDMAKLGVTTAVNATFKLKEGSSEYGPWGKEHTSSLVISMGKPIQKVIKSLYRFEFKIGEHIYTIVPNSIKQRHSRKTSARF